MPLARASRSNKIPMRPLRIFYWSYLDLPRWTLSKKIDDYPHNGRGLQHVTRKGLSFPGRCTKCYRLVTGTMYITEQLGYTQKIYALSAC